MRMRPTLTARRPCWRPRDRGKQMPCECCSNAGLTALLLAVENAHYELAALLLDRGADVNVAPKGWMVLHQISWVRKTGVAGSNNPAPRGSGNLDALEFVRKLVAHGASLNARVTKRPSMGITNIN